MKNKIWQNSLSWVRNLYEVGAPIRQRADDLEAMQRRLDRLKADMAAFVAETEVEVAKLWTAEEIAAAKFRAQVGEKAWSSLATENAPRTQVAS